jgi:uncharacterized protein YndB with AHSA1/START domain
MTDIRITRDFPQAPIKVWKAVTDPEIVPRWTATGRGGRPEGFSPTVGAHFRFVGKPVPGWSGVVECEVLEARAPRLLRYSWRGDENGATTEVTYRIEARGAGTRFTYEHTGFSGVGGFFMANFVLGPVRRKMLDKGLRAVLHDVDDEGKRRPEGTLEPSS